jgi:hypothetical protein
MVSENVVEAGTSDFPNDGAGVRHSGKPPRGFGGYHKVPVHSTPKMNSHGCPINLPHEYK